MTSYRPAWIIAPLLAALALTGCGGGDPAAAPSPSPSVKPDRYAVQTCQYLKGQDPHNGYSNDLALTMAGMSSMPDLVALAGTARQAGGDANVIRGWCARNVPWAGVTPAGPN